MADVNPLATARRWTAAGLASLLVACGGGSGGSGTGALTPSGTLDVAGCTIEAGEANCTTTIRWSSSAAASPRLLADGTVLATTAAGTAQAAIGFAAVSVALFDGGTRLAEKSVSGTCASASAWNGSRCRPFATRLQERAPTPFTESGAAVTLEVVLFRPPGAGPFPTVMFNHGSTGNGDDPSQFTRTYVNEAVARAFAERGWMVAFPQRRGRGASGGLYDEGFTPDRSRYSCLSGPALAGVERALADLDAAVDYLKSRNDVDSSRLISAGTSRGGILAVAHAGRRPADYFGVLNFVGGWIGEGCVDAVPVNRATFVRGAGYPGTMLWLYGEGDSFYSIPHSRGSFDAFTAAGGRASFLVRSRAPGLDGHFIVNDPSLWSADLDAWLRALGAD